jgi:aminopeptidase N
MRSWRACGRLTLAILWTAAFALPAGIAGVARAAAAAEARADTDVLDYQLDIEIIPRTNGGVIDALRVVGKSTIQFRSNVNGLATFAFDLRNELNILAVTGNVAVWIRDGQQITVQLASPLAAGEVSEVAVRYHGFPPEPNAFTWLLRGGKLVVATFSQLSRARSWWACKDVVDDKATIDLDVTVPAGLVAISNGIELGQEPRSGGRTPFLWSETRPIAPYLVSLAISNYQQYDLTWNYAGESGLETLSVPCWVYPEHWDASAGQPLPPQKAGCDEIPEMLETFSGLFGLHPFVGEKYGVVETGDPVFSSRNMEHQTVASLMKLDDFTNTVSHELAHQWWGDAVTCATWQDVWLNEGFADYSETLYREFRPGGTAHDFWTALPAHRPTNPDAQTYRPPGATILDNNAVYKKGAWVLHMLRGMLGDQAFFRALADYRAAHLHGSATTADFAADISASFGHDLTWFIDQWVMQPGSPDYVWSLEAEATTLGPLPKLRVRRTQGAEGFGVFTMPLELRLTTGLDTGLQRIWNDGSDETFTLRVGRLPTRVTLDEDGAPDRNWVLHGSKLETSDPVDGPPVLLAAVIAAAPGVEARATFWLSEDVGGLDA